LAKLARDLAGRGEARQALALVQAELGSGLSATDRGMLQLTLGWLEHQLAGQDRAGRRAHLEAARDWYRAGLQTLPDQRLGRANLALVEGDLALELGDRDAALARWREALSLVPDLPGAGERFLSLLGSDARALTAEAETLEAGGHTDLAREAWARAIRATPPEAQGEPCLRWMLLAAEAGEFTRDSVSEFSGGGAALAELRLLARDPLRAPTPSWAETPLGSHALASAYRSLAAERRSTGAATDALALLDKGAESAPKTPLGGRPPVAAALATERLELLLDEPGLDFGGDLTAAATGNVAKLPEDELMRETGLARRAHTALARSYLENGGGDPQVELELALAAARVEAPNVEFPAPELSAQLAALYAGAGQAERAIHAYLDAALGELALGRRRAAEEALREATALDLALGGMPRVEEVRARFGLTPIQPEVQPTGVPEDAAPRESSGGVDGILPRLFAWRWDGATRAAAYAPSEWYVGASIGGSRLASSDGDVEGDLSDLSYTVGVDLDGATTAYRFYGGYRFHGPLAVEVGYADHGTISSTVGPEPAVGLDQFLDDVAKTHPATGAGPTLALHGLLVGNDHFSLGAKVGAWWWSSDVEIQTTTQKVHIDRSGSDLFYGLDLGWHPGPWGSIKLELERYGIGDDDADVLAIGIELDPAFFFGR